MNNEILPSTSPFSILGFRVEPARLVISRSGRETRLESKAMGVLLYLVEHAGEVVSREELESQLWPGRIVTEDAVTNAIGKLRKAFSDDARNPRLIETIPKTGYRLIAPVSPVTSEEAEIASVTADASRQQSHIWRRLFGIGAGLLVFGVAAWYLASSPGKSTVAARPVVAVLAFDNLGPSLDQNYLADGITADLITDLSKLSALAVIAPSSVSGTQLDQAKIHELSKELGANYVVTGSVQKISDQLRVNVQLFEVSAGRAIWGERYTGASSQIFELQDALTATVVSALKINIVPQERAALSARPTESVIAYDHYLRGISAHGHRSKQDNVLAKAQFERAIEIDPEFARAYAGLAMAYSRDAIDGWSSDPMSSLSSAKRLVERALSLDSKLIQAYFTTGQIELFRRQHVDAIKAIQRGIEIDRSYADAYGLLAWVLNYAGRPDEALANINKAIRMNPAPSASYYEVLGEIQFVLRKYKEAAATFEKALQMNPEYMRVRMWYVAALIYSDQKDSAEWEATQLTILHPGFSLSGLEFAFPFKDPRELEHLLNALRKAGLRE